MLEISNDARRVVDHRMIEEKAPQKTEEVASGFFSNITNALIHWGGRTAIAFDGQDPQVIEKESVRRLKVYFFNSMGDKKGAEDGIERLKLEIGRFVKYVVSLLPEKSPENSWTQHVQQLRQVQTDKFELYLRVNIYNGLANLASQVDFGADTVKDPSECIVRLLTKPFHIIFKYRRHFQEDETDRFYHCADEEAPEWFQILMKDLMRIWCPEKTEDIYLPVIAKGFAQIVGWYFEGGKGQHWWDQLIGKTLPKIFYHMYCQCYDPEEMERFSKSLDSIVKKADVQEGIHVFFRNALDLISTNDILVEKNRFPLFSKVFQAILTNQNQDKGIDYIQEAVCNYFTFLIFQLLDYRFTRGKKENGPILKTLIFDLFEAETIDDLLKNVGIKKHEVLPLPESFREGTYLQIRKKGNHYLRKFKALVQSMQGDKKNWEDRIEEVTGNREEVLAFCQYLANKIWKEGLRPQIDDKISDLNLLSDDLNEKLSTQLKKLISDPEIEELAIEILECLILKLLANLKQRNPFYHFIGGFQEVLQIHWKDLTTEKNALPLLETLLEFMHLHQEELLIPNFLWPQLKKQLVAELYKAFSDIYFPLASVDTSVLPLSLTQQMIEKGKSVLSKQDLEEILPEEPWMGKCLNEWKQHQQWEKLETPMHHTLCYGVEQIKKNAPQIVSDPHLIYKFVIKAIKTTVCHLKQSSENPQPLTRAEKKQMYKQISSQLLAIFFPNGKEDLPVPSQLKSMLWKQLNEQWIPKAIEENIKPLFNHSEKLKMLHNLVDQAHINNMPSETEEDLQKKLEALLSTGMEMAIDMSKNYFDDKILRFQIVKLMYRALWVTHLGVLLQLILTLVTDLGIKTLWSRINQSCTQSMVDIACKPEHDHLVKQLLFDGVEMLKQDYPLKNVPPNQLSPLFQKALSEAFKEIGAHLPSRLAKAGVDFGKDLAAESIDKKLEHVLSLYAENPPNTLQFILDKMR